MEQVVIEPSGEWSSPKGDEATGTNGVTSGAEDDDDDDKIIEVREPGVTPVKQEPVATKISLHQTPVQSREPSTTSSATRPSTNKRPAAQVIDLTGSDDEEDSPVRPAKRPALNTASRSFPAPEFRASLNGSYTNGQNFSL